MVRTLKFSGTQRLGTGVPEPSRSRSEHGGVPAGPGDPGTVLPGLHSGGRAGPVLCCGSGGGAEHAQGCTQQPLSGAVRAGHPGGCWSPGGGVIAPREEALRFNDRSLGFTHWGGRGHWRRVHGCRGECLARMEGAGFQRRRLWARVTGLGRKLRYQCFNGIW